MFVEIHTNLSSSKYHYLENYYKNNVLKELVNIFHENSIESKFSDLQIH